MIWRTHSAKLQNTEILDFRRFEDNFSQMTDFDACRPHLAALCNMKHGDGTPYGTTEHVWRYVQGLNVGRNH